MRSYVSVLMAEVLVAGTIVSPFAANAQSTTAIPTTTTPINHIVVIFDENISFDHYFGTYPNAANPQGEPAFKPLPNTPAVNGLSGALISNNPNLNPANLALRRESLPAGSLAGSHDRSESQLRPRSSPPCTTGCWTCIR